MYTNKKSKIIECFVQFRQFDYVMFTGDIPPHNVWNQSRGDQTAAMATFNRYMDTYLPGKMVLPTLGNHESAPVNRYIVT